MGRSNATSPGRGTVASIQNKYRQGKHRTFNADTSGNANKGGPGLKVSFPSNNG